jgi:hypothetical protein
MVFFFGFPEPRRRPLEMESERVTGRVAQS